MTHPVNRDDKSDSVVGWVLKRHPEVAEIQDKYGTSVGVWADIRPGIVHRLDRETSGLLVIAKNQASFDYLKKLFKERAVKKTYLALAHGHLKNKSGIIESPIGKIPGRTGGARQSTRIHGKKELKEKNAITEYKVLKEYPEYSLVEVSPQTGRTHQIRVHLNSIGHPLICDPLYGSKKLACPPDLGRLFLHAQKLSFTPLHGGALSIETDLPPELQKFLDKLNQQ